MADLEIDNQYDFFREVRLDENGALLVKGDLTSEQIDTLSNFVYNPVSGKIESSKGITIIGEDVVVANVLQNAVDLLDAKIVANDVDILALQNGKFDNPTGTSADYMKGDGSTDSLDSLNLSDITDSNDTTTGTLVVAGGVGINKRVTIGGKTTILNTSNSTSSSTGAMIIAGGLGIGNDLYVGGGALTVGIVSGTAIVKVGHNRTSNGSSAIDLFSDASTPTTRKSRLIRKSGANGALELENFGTNSIIMKNSGTGVQLASGATAWTTVSDRTKKRDIVEIEDSLEKLKSLKGYYYNYILDEDETGRRVGVIAQEVQAVLPEAISEDPETGDLGVKYSELIPLLISANRELIDKVEALETRLNELSI